MNQRMRRLSRKIRRNLTDVKSVTTNWFGRSVSYAGPSFASSYRTSTTSPIESDDDGELVFEGFSTNNEQNRRGSLTLIPCEFCQVQQSSDVIENHQSRCTQNPVNANRRRLVTSNTTNSNTRSRFASDNVLSSPRTITQQRVATPTAPPRPRSPSPTEGYTAPTHLVCPIQMTVFHDPVVANDGHTYERSAIVNWLRTNHTSPVTRQEISKNTLNTNLLIKQLAEEFREECRKRRAMYPYRLDIDLKKTERIDHLSTSTKTFYHIEWCGENRNLTNSDFILVHLTDDQAEKIAEINCKLTPHPNIIRTSGRVEHQESGILLLQDNLPEQTLYDLLETYNEKLSICIIDTILYQTSFALQHLASQDVIHGNINMKNIYIDQIDCEPENIKIKLTNIAENNDTNDDFDAFARLAQQLYLSPMVGHSDDCNAREEFLEKLSENRLTFTQVTDMIIELIRQRKFDFPCLSD